MTVQTSVVLGGAALGAFKIMSDITEHKTGPISGYQCTQAGGQHLDNTMKLLQEKRGVATDEYILPAQERSVLHSKHDMLSLLRQQLELETSSYSGSIKNWSRARNFYSQSLSLKVTATSASERSMNAFGRSQAEAELAEAYVKLQAEAQSAGALEPEASSAESSDSNDASDPNVCDEQSLSRLQDAPHDYYTPSQTVAQDNHILPQYYASIQYPPDAARISRRYAEPAGGYTQYSGTSTVASIPPQSSVPRRY